MKYIYFEFRFLAHKKIALNLVHGLKRGLFNAHHMRWKYSKALSHFIWIIYIHYQLLNALLLLTFNCYDFDR